MKDFSSKDALSKFESWRDSQTSLRLIMVSAGLEGRVVDAGIVMVIACSEESVNLGGGTAGVGIRLSGVVDGKLFDDSMELTTEAGGRFIITAIPVM
jgi:hypothetical protein